MFIKNLKSQYLAYFLMSLSIGAKHIIKSFQGPEAFLYVSIDLVMVVALAFVLYTLAFCARMIWNRLSHKSRSRLPSIFAVLLIFASLVLCLSPNAEARRQAPTDPYEDRFGYGGVSGGSGGGSGGVARGTAIFIAGVAVGGSIRPGIHSRTVAGNFAQLPPGSRKTGSSPATSRVFLARGRSGISGEIGKHAGSVNPSRIITISKIRKIKNQPSMAGFLIPSRIIGFTGFTG